MQKEKFHPVLVSWQPLVAPLHWENVICRREIELEYFRENLKHVKHFEQRIYSVNA